MLAATKEGTTRKQTNKPEKWLKLVMLLWLAVVTGKFSTLAIFGIFCLMSVLLEERDFQLWKRCYPC